ncbi:hypothetical protein MC885_016549 [Smutsia gigantea]|nr:hypothetical protein MC885_016549 [Smutsia gigantea]
MQTAGGHRVLCDITTRWSKTTWNGVSLRKREEAEPLGPTTKPKDLVAAMDRHQHQTVEHLGWGPKPGSMTQAGHLESASPEPCTWPEEQVLINRRDITSRKDAWDMQEFITHMYVKKLLRHPAFQLLLAMLLEHYELFSIIDDIVLTILICEVLLGWFNGFWIFWKDGWNILNFIIIFILLLGFFVNELSVISITYTLRVLRLVHVCMAVEPLARIIRVILQSVPDMANIMALILVFMLVFSVFGVTLFGAFVPVHFQNMQVALYTLFICITQDGWVNIYSDFQ